MSQKQFIPQLKQFLSTNGCIYTLRAYNYSDLSCSVDDVGNCNRSLVETFYGWPTSEALEPYVANSGFLRLRIG